MLYSRENYDADAARLARADSLVSACLAGDRPLGECLAEMAQAVSALDYFEFTKPERWPRDAIRAVGEFARDAKQRGHAQGFASMRATQAIERIRRSCYGKLLGTRMILADKDAPDSRRPTKGKFVNSLQQDSETLAWSPKRKQRGDGEDGE